MLKMVNVNMRWKLQTMQLRYKLIKKGEGATKPLAAENLPMEKGLKNGHPPLANGSEK